MKIAELSLVKSRVNGASRLETMRMRARARAIAMAAQLAVVAAGWRRSDWNGDAQRRVRPRPRATTGGIDRF